MHCIGKNASNYQHRDVTGCHTACHRQRAKAVRRIFLQTLSGRAAKRSCHARDSLLKRAGGVSQPEGDRSCLVAQRSALCPPLGGRERTDTARTPHGDRTGSLGRIHAWIAQAILGPGSAVEAVSS